MRKAAAGIPAAAFDFLRGLAANNENTWFEANRSAYENSVKQPMAALVTAVSLELAVRCLPLEGEPKRSTFRLHRDVRFSKDKNPYKTAVGSVWYRPGSGKDGAGVLYFHLAPEGCFTAVAFYRPEPEVLSCIRERIRVHPERFLEAEAALRRAGLVLSQEDALRRMPRGFEDLQASPTAAALRLRSFLMRRPVPPEVVSSAGLVAAVADIAHEALPLLQFGWAAVDEVMAGA